MTGTTTSPGTPVSRYDQAVVRYADIAQYPHISLTTYTADGTGVPAVIRLAPYSGRFVTRVPERSGKAERIAHSSAVLVAVCEADGALLRDPVPAVARIMSPLELPVISVALTAKYGWWFRLCHVASQLGRLLGLRRFRQVGIEITLR